MRVCGGMLESFEREKEGRMSPCDQYQAAEVAWYRANGKYIDRIKHGSSGPYVAGDWSWNRSNPDRREFVEPMMTYALGDLETKLRLNASRRC